MAGVLDIQAEQGLDTLGSRLRRGLRSLRTELCLRWYIMREQETFDHQTPSLILTIYRM
jgi:hypothetical protein